nr:hypothetical protein [Bacteroidota bacterium]
MAVEIKPYTDDVISAVIDFNKRLKKGGATFKFPESNISKWLPKIEHRKIYQEYFLCLEKGSIVRGAYILKHQQFSLSGDVISIADYQLPISEGIINKQYNFVGVCLLTNALKKQPLLFALGMGGYEESLPKMIKAMRWELFSIPFYIKIIRTQQFLRNVTYFRNTILRRFLLDFIYVTGLGLIAVKLLQFFLGGRIIQNNSISCDEVHEFSSWANDLWEECKDKYAMIAVRDNNTLNILYPSDRDRFIRLKISLNDRVIGWVVVLNTKMYNHKQFGNMRVGSIIDCLALPENASIVIVCATKYLENAGVDIIVSNQSHYSLCSALKKAG